MGINSDSRRAVQLNLNFNWNARPSSDSWGWFFSPHVSWRPSGRQFNSNVVLRWEYRPGSALYLVWAQGRTASGGNGDFDLGGDLRGLFGVHPENVLMLKASYWFSP